MSFVHRLLPILLINITFCAYANDGNACFPVVSEIKGGDKDIDTTFKLHDLPGQSLGFALSVWHGEHVSRIKVVDAVSPTLIPNPADSEKYIGLTYREGANSFVLELLNKKNGDLKTSFSSNMSCIYSPKKIPY